MMARLEHANIIVRDIEGMLRFLQAAFPDFRTRARGRNKDGTHWVHVGTDETYVALNSSAPGEHPVREPYVGVPGTNHLGYVVADAAVVRTRLASAGYTESTPPNDHPHRVRVYFYDAEGNDWEFVQYFSDDPAERNDYALDP